MNIEAVHVLDFKKQTNSDNVLNINEFVMEEISNPFEILNSFKNIVEYHAKLQSIDSFTETDKNRIIKESYEKDSIIFHNFDYYQESFRNSVLDFIVSDKRIYSNVKFLLVYNIHNHIETYCHEKA